MKAVFITSFSSGEMEAEIIDDVSGWDLSAYAEAQVKEEPGRCACYLQIGRRLVLAAEAERYG